MAFRSLVGGVRPAIINGTAGFVVFSRERPFAVLGLTYAGDAIVEIDVVLGPERLAQLDLEGFRSG
jgi:hypothetical protein